MDEIHFTTEPQRSQRFFSVSSVSLWFKASSSKHPTWQSIRHRAVVQNDSTINDDIEDAFAEMMRIFVGGDVADLCGIEDDHIRLHARTEHAAIGEVRAIGSLRCRLTHRLFEREEMLVAHVMA